MSDYERISTYRIVQPPVSVLLPVQLQIICTDWGPWADHNVACACCGDTRAILDMNFGVFIPCDKCRKEGWSLSKRKKRFWRRRA